MTSITTIAPGRGPYEKDVSVLAMSATAVSCAADTAENTLATYTLVGYTMGPRASIRIKAEWSYTGSANAKTLRIKFGGTDFLSVGDTAPANTSAIGECQIYNRGSQSSQRGSGTVISNGATVFAGTVQTATVDTSAAVTILITGQKASAGETLTLESYTIEILKVP